MIAHFTRQSMQNDQIHRFKELWSKEWLLHQNEQMDRMWDNRSNLTKGTSCSMPTIFSIKIDVSIDYLFWRDKILLLDHGDFTMIFFNPLRKRFAGDNLLSKLIFYNSVKFIFRTIAEQSLFNRVCDVRVI